MLKVIAPIILFSSFVHAAKVTCQVNEVFSGQESNRQVIFEGGPDNKSRWNVDFAFGPGQVVLMNDELSLTVEDPTTKKNISAKLGALPGGFSRLQVIPDEVKNDYLMMDCQVEGSSPFKIATGAKCVLSETAGASHYDTSFDVPVAKSGHDIFALPEAKLAPLTGWVMMYNGVLMTSIQNSDTSTSVTALANWEQPTLVSWFPSKQNINVTVSCQPTVQ